MKTFFITGTSKGIGKALKEQLIDTATVYSIGRKDDDFQVDFEDLDTVNNFEFPSVDTEEVILINNAGMLGEINPIMHKKISDAPAIFAVNTLTPILLSEKFIKRYSSKKLTIITISSGAGRRAIPSWANYCASKAAVDLFSETLQEEAEELNIDLKVFSIAPGVVDTDMQQAIRNTTTSSFSQVEKYQKLFANGELLTPEFGVS